MPNVNDLAKETLILLKQRGLKPTPENYTEVFEELSDKYGMSGGLREKLAKFKALLLPTYQDEPQLQKAANMDELLSYLISRLNRLSKQNAPDFYTLLQSVFKNLLVSKDKKVREIASMSATKTTKNMENESIFLLEKKWNEFALNYKEGEEFERRLAEFGIKNEDFVLIINKLLTQLKARSYKRFVRLLTLCLQPSLCENERLKNFANELLDKPYLMALKEGGDDAFYYELTQMVNKRVGADKIFIQQNLGFFDEHLRNLAATLDATANLHKKNFNAFNSHKMGDKITLNFEDLKAKFDVISEKIATANKQVEKMNDPNEREEWSLQSHILRLDEAFLQGGANYALCVFSVGNYRFIIEKYGLKNLNEILSRFRRILRVNCGKLDELWMLDEKSYLMIIYEQKYNKIIEFMQKNTAQLENFKFIYKDEVIKPKILSFCMDKQSYPHLNILDEIVKKIEQ